MRLPNRPTSIADLKERIDSGELRESRVLEFKRQFPRRNADTARGIAGFAAEGGVLVIGVAEPPDGLEVTPFDCTGARERVENIARDIPEPPVQVESHILADDAAGRGVLWIGIPASAALLHQVAGTYYTRDDTQTRPMSDAEVADRMELRKDRGRPIELALDRALAREQPVAPELCGRTCIVARPIGADPEEFYTSTSERTDWKAFASELALRPWSFSYGHVPNQFWGKIDPRFGFPPPSYSVHGNLSGYFDIEFQDDGAFHYLSYSQDGYEGNENGILPFVTLEACRDAISIISEIQARTGQRRMWDLAFSISDVAGRRSRSRESPDRFHMLQPDPIPRDEYRATLLGVSPVRLETDVRIIVEHLAGRFINESDLRFDEEWSG